MLRMDRINMAFSDSYLGRSNTRFAWFTFFAIFFMPFQKSGFCQSSFQDSIRMRLAKIQGLSKKVDSLSGWYEVAVNENYNDALELGYLGSQISGKLGDKKKMATFEIRIGNCFQGLSKYDSAETHYNRAMSCYQDGDFQKERAGLHIKLANLMVNIGSFDKAFEQANLALKMHESLGNQQGIGDSFIEISNALWYLERYQEGEEYGLKALQIFETLHDTTGQVMAFQMLANQQLGMEGYEQAFVYSDKGLRLFKEMGGNGLELASYYNTRGNVLKHLKRYDEAIQDYEACFEIVKPMGHHAAMSVIFANIGDVYMRQGYYEKALPLKLESLQMQEDLGFTSNLSENYMHLSEIYEKIGNFQEALRYFKLFSLERDSAVSAEKDKAATLIKTQYETEKKDQQIEAQQKTIAQSQLIQSLSFGIAILLVLFIVGLFYVFRKIQQKNKLLNSQNQLIGERNKQNELLLKEIHHRVKNNLQTISSLLSLQSESITDSSAYDAVQESKNRVASMALIHQKLYQGDNLAGIEMKDYFETVGKAIIESFGEKASGVQLEVDMPKLELDVDTAIPIGLITNELVTNALKYAFEDQPKGEIWIKLRKTDGDYLELEVADNGKFRKPTRAQSESAGFGSMLVQLLTMQLRGDLNKTVESGTSTIIRFRPDEKSVA